METRKSSTLVTLPSFLVDRRRSTKWREPGLNHLFHGTPHWKPENKGLETMVSLPILFRLNASPACLIQASMTNGNSLNGLAVSTPGLWLSGSLPSSAS